MSSVLDFPSQHVVAIDSDQRSRTWSEVVDEAIGERGEGARAPWSVCSTDDKWVVLNAVVRALLEGDNVLFVGGLFSADHAGRALASLPNHLAPGHMAFLTSGSTGQPKLVVHRSESLLTSAARLVDRQGLWGSRVHHLFPATYMAGVLNCTVLPLVAGGTACFGRPFDAIGALGLPSEAARMDTEVAWMSPRMLATVGRLARRHTYSSSLKSRWKLVIAATAPLAAARRDEFMDALSIPVRNSYGTTEQLFISCEEDVDVAVSCGRPLPGVGVTTETSVGESPANGEPGRLYVRSETSARVTGPIGVSLELQDTRATNEVWIPTGDWGYIADGLLHVVGRADDVIVSGGLNVSPLRVEEVATSVFHFDDVCCFSFIDDKNEIRVGLAAEVHSSRAQHHDSASIRLALSQELPPEAVPRWVQVLEQMPRTSNGKCDIAALRRLALSESDV